MSYSYSLETCSSMKVDGDSVTSVTSSEGSDITLSDGSPTRGNIVNSTSESSVPNAESFVVPKANGEILHAEDDNLHSLETKRIEKENITFNIDNADSFSDNANITTGNVNITTDNVNNTTGNVNITTDNVNNTTGNVNITTDNVNNTTITASSSPYNKNTTTDNASITTDNANINTDNVNIISGNANITYAEKAASISINDNTGLVRVPNDRPNSEDVHLPKSCLSPPSYRRDKSKINIVKKVRWKRTTSVTLKWRRALTMVTSQLKIESNLRTNRSKLFKGKKRSAINFQFGRDIQEYVNPAFEIGEEGGGKGKFADIVENILKQPSVCDLHPYGRGNLYASIFEQRDLGSYTDNGKLISWVVVVIMVVGVAGGIVMLAISRDMQNGFGTTPTVNTSAYT